MFNIHIHINVSLNKNINPSCGVEDYQKTWDNFYDAANLRETYNFMASGTQVKENLLRKFWEATKILLG